MILLYRILLSILVFGIILFILSKNKSFTDWCDETNIKLMKKQQEILKKATKKKRK